MNIVHKVSPTFIVAELGSNHANDLTLACESIVAAKEAGADAIKFQSISLDALYLDPSSETKALHRLIDLEEQWYQTLKSTCDQAGIEFFSSPTYLGAIACLEAIGVTRYKLASAQVGTFPQLVAKVAALGKPTLLSTGLVDYRGLTETIQIFNRHHNPHYTILHCNSLYPPAYHEVHLGLMDTYRHMFQCPVGYSDHTLGIALPIAAVARGASVIEKHFVLDKNLPTPDAAISIEPDEFRQMVEGIRAVESALIPQPRLALEPRETDFRDRIATRLVLAVTKPVGAHFQESDFQFLRHPQGIDCRDLDWVIAHMQTRAEIPAGTLLTWDMLQGKSEKDT